MSDNLIDFTPARKQARGTQHSGWLAGGTFAIYSGTPVTGASPTLTTQTLLVQFTLPDPFGTVDDDVLTSNAIATAMVIASGTHTASFGLAYDSSDELIGVYSVGISGSGAAAILDDLELVEGALVSMLSFTIIEG